jgi:hypothetical protein
LTLNKKNGKKITFLYKKLADYYTDDYIIPKHDKRPCMGSGFCKQPLPLANIFQICHNNHMNAVSAKTQPKSQANSESLSLSLSLL